MSAKKVIKNFLEVRKEYPNSWAMFHARYATHGVKNEDNCHPFKVPSNPETYLAHNGILDIDIKAGDKRSDTRVFAEDTLPAMGGVTALDDDHVWTMVSKWATGSKLVIFTLDPAAKEQCYIVNETAGHWDNDGMWWSNNTYKQSTWSSYLSTPADKKDKADEEIYTVAECPSCKAVGFEDANPYYCEMCYSCYDCNGMYGDSCLCWTPDNNKYSQKAGYYNGSFGW
jgi:glutamine amidotransferase